MGNDNKTKNSNLMELKEKISSTNKENMKLHFITRILKEGISKRTKSLNKYVYKVYQINVDDEIRDHLYSLSLSELQRVIDKDFSLIDYDPITDDTEHLFTYKMKEGVTSFSDVVVNQLGKEVPTIQSIEGVVSDVEELWAYCIGFYDSESHDWVYTFRKIINSQVAIDENNDPEKNIVVRAIRTLFDTTSKQLTLMKGEAITLDKQIDCIFYDDTFYVLKKLPFEQILGLQEEYHAIALEVIDAMEQTGLISGLDTIQEELKTNTTIHKKLVKIQRTGGLTGVDTKKIKSMARVARKYGETLHIDTNGK